MKSKSLEALERIGNYPIDLGMDNSYEPPKSCGNVSIGLCFQEEFDLIKQDLERLEKIENYPPEFDGFLYSFEGLIERNKKLEKENQDLKIENFELDLVLNKNSKLKKAIEIFKRFYQLEESGLHIGNMGFYGIFRKLTVDDPHNITKQEYELLKEVLENE